MSPANSSSYRFSAVLSGHSSDVRCLTSFRSASSSTFSLVSGSRDLKAKLWSTTPESKDREWAEAKVFATHQKYITAVATMDPNETFKEGLIYTGEMSGVIRAFVPSSSDPVFEAEAHAHCVSSLFVSPTGTLLSGSWDHTAKVWVDRLKPVMTLSGHQNSIWTVAILPECGIMVTGSADKSIRLWKAGVCQGIVEDAHDQAIRDICVLSSDTFLTAGNDGCVKVWAVDVGRAVAKLAKTIHAHEHFIYAITMIDRKTENFAVVGENSGIKIFRGEEEVQTLPIPAISVWDVVALSNGDIAASGSDGKVWIFSSDPKRFAEEDMNALYELELSKFKRPATTELEGVNTDDLPGPNVLLAPGKRDGQTKMVKEGGVITVHSWSQADQKWTKIGDVVGQPGEDTKGAAPDGGKVVFEGKEYDFVFDIELDAGEKLKLPFSRTDDVWHTAQSFIHKHELPQVHLETIANFLTRNGGVQMKSSSPNGGVWDPFTGEGAYTTNGDNASMDVDTNPHFPQTNFLTFSAQPKYDAMTKKMKELNLNVPAEKRVSDEQLERLPLLCKPGGTANIDDVLTLVAVLRWPQGMNFPALDILRLAVINTDISLILSKEDISANILSILNLNIHSSAPENSKMLALRGFVNFFSSQRGKQILLKKREEVLPSAVAILPQENKNTQIALSTLILNYTVALCSSGDAEGQSQCVTSICMLFLEAISDMEAKYRVLVALGTLLHNSGSNVKLAKDLQAAESVRTWKLTAASAEGTPSEDSKKVEDCASSVLRLL